MARLLTTEELIARVRAFGALSPNWNGYGGLTPSPSAAESCVQFLLGLGELPILPTPTVSGDGEVTLFLERDGVTIEIGFRGDGVYGFLLDLPRSSVEKENASLADVRWALSLALAHAT